MTFLGLTQTYWKFGHESQCLSLSLAPMSLLDSRSTDTNAVRHAICSFHLLYTFERRST